MNSATSFHPPGVAITPVGALTPAQQSIADFYAEKEAQEMAARKADPTSPFPDVIYKSEPLEGWDELSKLPRVAVTAAQISDWQNDPYPLLKGEVFVNPDGLDGEPEAWKVCAILSTENDTTVYYTQNFGENEAYKFTDYFFWDMLANSERVVQG
ncbi:hypothetical protein MSAN_02236700 [Mycena sanguinolenta]|uniref:Uncharacterized protein n=1 Tax=Mycena sanguinolenta TaxID=230812 RepID=A0A8H6XBD6_9AGAR|nr:hypothetical protein MSAN_02236700 [Mycena sanguinolenta]